jgi:16S rRNA (uracil1498-N3)-methyltransferase
MRLPRVYIDKVFTQDSALTLPNKTRHHLVNVLRLKKGNQLILFDGKSHQEAIAVITLIERKSAIVSIQSMVDTYRESPLNISLIQAISASDKMDITIQKAVELGVKSIQPIFTERSQRPWKQDRLTKKLSHWNNIIIHACEQSGRTLLPQLRPPVSFQDYTTNRPPDKVTLLLHPGTARTLTEVANPTHSFEILIGPEGGFSPQEVVLAQQTGIKAINIGPRILRTETAGSCILTWLQCQYGDLNSTDRQ